MPKAKIVSDNKSARTTLNNLVREGVVKKIVCQGTDIYARTYLTNQQIKRAYLRRINEKR